MAAAPGRRPVRPPSSRRATVRKPRLPDERPRIGAEAYRDLRGAAGPGELDDLVKAFGAAGEALAGGEPERALPYLEWLKARAPRSVVVREALGVARYLQGDFTGAASELTAYRRLSGRNDQNHLLADTARAGGRVDKATGYVEEMMRSPDVGRDRVAEGLLVLAGARADEGDLAGALEVLERADLNPQQVESWHPRLWYAAADFAERAGDVATARDYLDAVVSVDPDFLDAQDRLAALGD